METSEIQTVGSTVALDYRTAAVFQKYGIDFCCKGGLSIAEACQRKGVNKTTLLDELETVTQGADVKSDNFNSWELDKLVDYIVNKHHAYISEQVPILLQFLNKLCKVHGERHPELFAINEEFNYVAEELTMHMKKEELILFPAIKSMVNAARTNQPSTTPPFGSVQNPIAMMMHEHEIEGNRFVKIEKLTSAYTPPADGCTTYRVAFQMLKDFQVDLHKHIHLENNILFPKAAELETVH